MDGVTGYRWKLPRFPHARPVDEKSKELEQRGIPGVLEQRQADATVKDGEEIAKVGNEEVSVAIALVYWLSEGRDVNETL